MSIDKVAKTSENLEDENLAKLRGIFPQFVKEGTIDFDALQNFFENEGLIAGPEKYGLNWAGRSDAFRAIRVPSTGTLTPEPEESKNWDETENIFIEGDNLEVLKLLQKHYREKVKMIYIDPPYNTGKDFVYKDNFTQGVADYYEQTGQTKDGIKMTANTEKNGRYHSDWLTMMYPRLFVARNLLKDDGVIFVSIDDNEVANLRMIMDEIFGEENFINMITIKMSEMKGAKIAHIDKKFPKIKEYLVIYSKNKEQFRLKPVSIEKKEEELKKYTKYYSKRIKNINEPVGDWIFEKIEMEMKEKIENANSLIYLVAPDQEKEIDIPFNKFCGVENSNEEIDYYYNENGTIKKVLFLSDYVNSYLGDLWLDISTININKENYGIPTYTNGQKPIDLLLNILKSCMENNDIVLDFFAGSGTTADALLRFNQKYSTKNKFILVQIPELIEISTGMDQKTKKTTQHLIDFLDGINKPKLLTEIGKERIRRAGEKIGKGDVGFKSFRLTNSNYRKWNEFESEDDTETILKESKLFIEKPLVDGYDEKSVVYEILEKEGFGPNAEVSKEKGGLDPWIVSEGERKLVVTFAQKVSKENVDALKLSEHDIFVCFDNALDDTTKVNVGRNVNLKTI